jgi:molecular chaperone GrpE
MWSKRPGKHESDDPRSRGGEARGDDAAQRESITPEPAPINADGQESGPIDLGDIGVYEQTIAKLQEDKAELNERLLRTLADYQNSQRRAVNNEREAKQQGIVSVVSNVLTVLDHFDLALQQDPSKSSAQQIIDGVKVIRDELVRVLANHGVAQIAPQTSEEFDPMRHEALMQQAADGVEPGHIVSTLQPGYVLQTGGTGGGERVIRSAKVIVTPG